MPAAAGEPEEVGEECTMERGPVEVLFLAHPLDADPDQVIGVLSGPVDAGHLRVIDLVLFVRTLDGSLDVRDVEDERWAQLVPSGMELDPHTLLNDLDLELLSESLLEDQQGVAVVVEHIWAKEAAAELDGLEAELALYVRVPADVVEAAFAASTED